MRVDNSALHSFLGFYRVRLQQHFWGIISCNDVWKRQIKTSHVMQIDGVSRQIIEKIFMVLIQVHSEIDPFIDTVMKSEHTSADLGC